MITVEIDKNDTTSSILGKVFSELQKNSCLISDGVEIARALTKPEHYDDREHIIKVVSKFVRLVVDENTKASSS